MPRLRLATRSAIARIFAAVSAGDGVRTGRTSAIGLPLRAMMIVSPDSTRSINSERRAFASASPMVMLMRLVYQIRLESGKFHHRASTREGLDGAGFAFGVESHRVERGVDHVEAAVDFLVGVVVGEAQSHRLAARLGRDVLHQAR